MQAIQCGLTIDEFWHMTWRDFSINVIAWQRNQILDWERTRKIAHTVYSTVVEKSKWMREDQWLPLPSHQNGPKPRILSPAEVKAAIALYN